MPDVLDQAVQDYVTSAKAQTQAGFATTPQDAARSVQLGDISGTPAPAIAGDVKGFDAATKRSMASVIVERDPQLMAYVHSHPMAAAVSQNDWGNLSMLSQAAGSHAGILKSLNAPWDRGFDAALEAMKDDFNAPVRSYSPQDVLNKYPALQKGGFAGTLAATVGAFGGSAVGLGLDAPSNFASGLIHGAGAFVNQLAKTLGVPDADLLSKDVMGELERQITDPTVALAEGPKATSKVEADAIKNASQVARSFIHTLNTFSQAGKEVPKGVVPVVDSLRAGVNAHLVEGLDHVVRLPSETKDNLPGFFGKHFMEPIYGNARLGISSDAAVALYGDKLPEPGDGLLGWVPGIADKLDLARQTGADVEVPIADYVANIDPAVHKQLRDDTRIWPGGVTAREGADLAGVEPKLMVEDTLPQVRGSYGLEPMFSMGDRKLTLQSDIKEPFQGAEMHTYNILDESGKKVGDLALILGSDGKLHIEQINGVAGQWANSFGPALIRDLARQVKALYPDHDSITGWRVSGARPEPEQVTVRLDEGPKGWGVEGEKSYVEQFRDLLGDAHIRKLSEDVNVAIIPTELYSANEKKMAGIVHEEISRITGGRAKVIPSAGIDYAGVGRPSGLYVSKANLIIYDLLGHDPLSTGRHESIHFLRDNGLFSDKEWETLSKTAQEEGWRQYFNIDSRYPNVPEEVKVEESIAEAFRAWATGKDAGELQREYSPVAKIFQKIMDLLDRIRARFTELFGHEPTADELFQKVSGGEVGQRAMQGTGGSGDVKFSMDDARNELENLKASGLGLDSKTYEKLSKLYEERRDRDLAAAQKRAEKDQAKRQGKEWKDNRAAMRTDVEQTIRQRPDIAVDQFLGAGQMHGQQMPQRRYSLLESDLTAEQKKLLPSSYYSKSGFPVDEVAKEFGYPDGESMIQHLGSYNAAKSGRSAKEMLEHTIDVETDRQMEAKYGDLPSNILSEAKAQAFADSEVHIVTEEYQAAAQMARVTAVDRAVIAQSARDSVNKMAFEGISSDKFSELVKKAQDIAVRALAVEDPATAMRALQQRTLNAHIAAEIKKVEKQVPKFQRLTKFYAKPWDVTKPSPVDPEWSLFTRNLLSKVGLPSGMSIQGMSQAIGRKRFTDLADFVTKMENENQISGLQLPVPDWLLRNDPQQKPFKDLTVEEWRDVNQSLVTFDTLGRNEQKAVTADAKVDKAELIGKMRAQLAKFFDPITKDLSQRGAFGQAVGHFIAASTSNETLMSRFDHRNTHGIFTETFSKPAASAANAAAVMERETGKALRELGPVKDGERTLQSPFVDPRTKQPVQNFTYNNLAVVLSNMGNDYNFKTLAKGWKLEPEQLWKWAEKATEDRVDMLERAQEMGKIWKGLWNQSSAMYERLYGMAPEAVEPRPFEMHGRMWDGWYHPIIGDSDLSRYVNQLPQIDKAPYNYWPSPSNNYIKRRTGAIQVLDLSYDQIGVRLSQEIHDIAFHEFTYNTAKIMKDQAFRQAVTGHYGKEYMDQMDGWLDRAAGKNSFNGAAMRVAQAASSAIRQNVISTYIAFNPITAAKHGSTAWMMSSRELDPNIFKSVPKFVGFTGQLKMNQWFGTAVSDLYGKSPQMGDKLWDWAMNNFEELQRRERYFQDTIGGAQGLNRGELRLRDRVAQIGASLVAWSDLQSAVPLAIAKYREEFERTGEHGTATREGDMAVRRAHGSTAITNLPAIATSQDLLGPWMTSLYGFMGTNMQRRIEIFHDMNDQWNLGMKHAITSADSKLPTILSSLATYVVWTGIVEEVASQQFFSDRRGIGEKTLGWVFGTLAQTVIGVRDVVYDLQTGKADAGLISTLVNDASGLIRDVRKPNPVGKAHVGKFVADGCAVIGDLFGVCPRHVGKAAQYGIDVFSGYQQPRSAWDMEKGVVTGTQKQKVVR